MRGANSPSPQNDRPQVSVTVTMGDCRDLFATVVPQSIDCIITDPPYGQTALPWDKWPAGWLHGAAGVLKPTGSMWVFGNLRLFMERAAEFTDAGWRLAQDVVWEKHNGSGFASDRFRRVHEQAAMFYRADAPWEGVYKDVQKVSDATARKVNAKLERIAHTGKIGAHRYATEEGGLRLMRSVIFAPSMHGNALHPTQKPEAIVAPLLLFSCPPGGVVLDPMAGSGTTGVVARAHGRRAVLFESDANYVAAIRARLRDDAPLLSVAHRSASEAWGEIR